MMMAATYWLFIALVSIGKVVAIAAWIIYAIVLPLTRIQVAAQRRSNGFDRSMLGNLAFAAVGVVGTYVLLENVRIFTAAF